MKTSKNIFLVLIVMLLATTSCEEFLEEDNRQSLTAENFFTSDGQLVLGVNGIYRNLFSAISPYGDLRGLNQFIRGGADDVGSNRTRFFANNYVVNAYQITESNMEEAPIIWARFYSAINDANLIIQAIDENRGNFSTEIANRSTGEAIFLRALSYYHLTNLWGDVPFFNGSVSVTANSDEGRIDKTLIREKQIEALSRIEGEGLLSTNPYPGNDAGRPTLMAAKTLKAKIMLWLGDYQGALSETQDVINVLSATPLRDFEDIFKVSQSEEGTDVYHPHNIFGYNFNATEAGDIVGTAVGRAFTPNGGEESGFAGMEFADGINPFSRGTSNMHAYDDFYRAFPEGSRKEATYSDGTDVTTNNVPFNSGFIYLEKMYAQDPDISRFGLNGDYLIIFRYGDVLLMAAEAAAELGQDAIARGYLDQIQIRGNGSASPTSAQGLMQDIRDERGWELTAEGFRRYDLIRWGILVETMKNAAGFDVLSETGDRASNNIQERHNFLPIPPQELQLNPALLASDPTNNGYR